MFFHALESTRTLTYDSWEPDVCGERLFKKVFYKERNKDRELNIELQTNILASYQVHNKARLVLCAARVRLILTQGISGTCTISMADNILPSGPKVTLVRFLFT